MPFDSALQAFTGLEARAPRETAREAFIAVLSAVLNDAQGPHYAPLGLSPARLVLVTPSRAEVGERYASGAPVVFVLAGPEECFGKVHRRHKITLDLDFGVKVTLAANRSAATAQEVADAQLAGAVADAVRAATAPFKAAGLNLVTIAPDTEGQRAGRGRNPHRVMLWLSTLDA